MFYTFLNLKKPTLLKSKSADPCFFRLQCGLFCYVSMGPIAANARRFNFTRQRDYEVTVLL